MTRTTTKTADVIRRTRLSTVGNRAFPLPGRPLYLRDPSTWESPLPGSPLYLGVPSTWETPLEQSVTQLHFNE